MSPVQGEIWWAENEHKRRPVLIVTRSEVLPRLSTFVVAPITRRARGVPTEIPLGHEEGLSVDCVASFDYLQPSVRSALTTRIGSLHTPRREICRALAALADC